LKMLLLMATPFSLTFMDRTLSEEGTGAIGAEPRTACGKSAAPVGDPGAA
jgi:hypothetical protein